MTIRRRRVEVVQLPEQLNGRRGRFFSREIARYVNVDRPYLVLDCSSVRSFDKPVVHLMLCCLEGAMKRNGDVKLAGIPPTTDGILILNGVHRLFEMFETVTEAVNSFHQLPFEVGSETHLPGSSQHGSESVA